MSLVSMRPRYRAPNLKFLKRGSHVIVGVSGISGGSIKMKPIPDEQMKC